MIHLKTLSIMNACAAAVLVPVVKPPIPSWLIE